jgi:hypothetical protein
VERLRYADIASVACMELEVARQPGERNGIYRDGTRTKRGDASSEIDQPIVTLCTEVLKRPRLGHCSRGAEKR